MRKVIGLLMMGVASFSVNAVMLQDATAAAIEGVAETRELGKRYTLQSEVLGEKREVLVRLPKSYKANREARFPVIFLLDGDNHFGHVAMGAEQLEDNDRMPEAIIVALPNGQGTRGRDLAREQDNFRRFIGEEVFSFVNDNFRTNGHKTLFGHSLAGYFTLTMLADHKDMFDNYIAASPVAQVRNSEVIEKLRKLFEADTGLSKSLYFTLTDEVEEGQRATTALNNMVAMLGEKAPKNLDWKYDFVGNQVHMTTPFLTVYEGLTHSFSDYQAPRYASVEALSEAGGIDGLKQFYANRAEKYGTDAVLPQVAVRRVAYLYRGESMHDEAIKLFRENIKNYPDSPRVYNSLGDGLDAAGQHKEALEAYQTAVKMAEEQGSGNAGFFKRQVMRLEEKLAE